jgi:hypothetical protein
MIEITFEDQRIVDHSGIINIWSWSHNSFKDRPNMFSIDEYYAFHTEIHEWFLENGIQYSLEYNNFHKTTIVFKNESDALLFKLTWL